MNKHTRTIAFVFLLFAGNLQGQVNENNVFRSKQAPLPFPEKTVIYVASCFHKTQRLTIKKPNAITPDSLEKSVRLSLVAASASCPNRNANASTLILSARRTSPDRADVQWEARFAYEAVRFQLERSFGDTLHFEAIANRLSLKRNAAKQTFYLRDINATEQATYYRVRQFGNTNVNRISNIAAVPGSLNETLKVYPNPAKNVVWVEVSGIPAGRTVLSIIDVKGQTVMQQAVNFPTALSRRTSIDISALPPGLYEVKAFVKDASGPSGRFVKQ